MRDSSLSASTQAVLCAEVGHLELAHDYVREAALVDLLDLQEDTNDGVHIASLAGAWVALVEGLGGLRVARDVLTLAPALPDAITRLAFRVRWQGMRLMVEVGDDEVRCHVDGQSDARVSLRLYGEEVEVTSARPVTRRSSAGSRCCRDHANLWDGSPDPAITPRDQAKVRRRPAASAW